MSDPAPRPRPDETYTEEMQRWMSRQSFWYRLRHFRRHPDARPVFLSIFVVAGWMVPLAGLVGFAFYVLVHRYTGSGEFTRLIEQEAAEVIGLNAPTLNSAQWKSGAITLTGLTGEGKPGGFIRSLKIGSIRFETSFRDLFSPAIEPDGLAIQGLELDLRGGLLGPAEADRLTREQSAAAEAKKAEMLKDDQDPGPYSGRLGIDPDGALFSARSLVARNTTVRWGLNENSGGSIEKTTLEATRTGAKSWLVRCTGGEFSMGWLRRAAIDELSFDITPEAMVLRKFDFRLPQAEGKQGEEGTGQGSGKIVLGAKPAMDWEIALRGVEVNRLLPAHFQRIFTGKLHGKATIRGTTGDEAGFTSQLVLEFLPGFGFGTGSPEVFPILEVLGGEIAEMPVRYIEAAKGGITMTIAKGKVQAEGVSIQAADGERIEGTFAYDPANRSIDGVFRIGIKPKSLADHSLIEERFFREETAGLRWLTLPMQGALATSTSATADGLRAVLRQETEARRER